MPTGLRERKKLDTRRALCESALALALERGFDGFTIGDVTEAVGVSRRTFSNYFAGKAECLVAITDGWVGELLQTVTEAPPELPLAVILQSSLVQVGSTISGGMDRFFMLLRGEPELQAAALAGDAAQLESIAAAIADRVGAEPTDLRIVMLARYSMYAGRYCIEKWITSGRDGGPEALHQMLEQAFSVIDTAALQR